MSTRSGKRIHNPSDEDIDEQTAMVSKIERKTRSKRVVENQGVIIKTKKRRNYVSYPADENTGHITGSNNIENENPVKPGRVLRTLKEQNAVSDEVELPTTKKQVRQTRRTKKFSETAAEEPPETPHHEAIEVVPITNGKSKSKKNKKKNKKVTEHAIDKENEVKEVKKKNKRKRHSQSNAFVEPVEETGKDKKNESNMSIDSFHSAAGSPVGVNMNGIMSPQDKSSPLHFKVNPAVNDSAVRTKKKRSSLKNKSFESHSLEAFGMDVDAPVNTTFDKEPEVVVEESKKRKSSLKNTTVDGDLKRSSLKNKSFDSHSLEMFVMDVGAPVNTTFDKEPEVVVEESKKRKSSLKNTTVDGDLKSQVSARLNTTFEKEPTIEMPVNKNKRKSNSINITIENIDVPKSTKTDAANLDIQKKLNGILNVTFEKDDIIEEADTKKLRKSSSKEPITDVYQISSINSSQSSNGVIGKARKSSPRKSFVVCKDSSLLNGTFEISPEPDIAKQRSLNTTFDKQPKLDTTFDKTDTQLKSDSKSSLISSDDTETSNITLDKSDELSKVSITDDDSKTENILNQTPVLIESSMEASMLESSLKENTTPESKLEIAPLKREGTFTKDNPEVPLSPKQTPTKRQTMPTAGCTPYHSNGKRSEKKSILNLTHSIEKAAVRSSLVEVPRTTRVMFCSPVNNPVAVLQRKSKIIKSNLKGSNKSFVYEETEPIRAGRKRSFTQCEEYESRAKRTRLGDARPAERGVRARTASAMAKMSTAVTPQKSTTPSKPKSDMKGTRLPNFAALHARSFERMESLDECQRRRARRARQLLEPTGSLAVLERSSPRVTLESKSKETPPKLATPAKPATPAKLATPAKPAFKLPTLDTLQKGYTRFGFRMHCDVNPFSVPSKVDKKPKEVKAKVLSGLRREVTQPSLAGATSLRRAAAKQTIMREKSFTQAEKIDEKRKECRTVIKGVRTNRRFELQMKSRNING